MSAADQQDATIGMLIAAMPMALEEDFLLALRYAYYVKAAPLVPDALYDQAEREFINRPEVDDSPLMQPGSDNDKDYPRRVKALWLYLFAAREDRRPKDAAAPLASAPPARRKRSGRVKTAEKPADPENLTLF